MNKLFSLAAVALVSVTAFAQEIDFKVEYKEKTTYTQKTVTDMNMVISHPSEGTFEQPMDVTVTYTIKTDKKAANGDVPFTGNMKMESEMMAEKADEMSNNSVSGHINKGTAVIDTFTVEGMPEAESSTLKEGFAKSLSQFTSSQKLKVGQSFTVNSLPTSLGGVEIDADKIAIIYTLKKVEGTKATFDVLLKETTVEISSQGIDMKCTLNITGTMTYLTDKQYVSAQDLVTTAKFITPEEIGMTMDMTGKTTQTTTSAAN